jgi:hypothetical protein
MSTTPADFQQQMHIGGDNATSAGVFMSLARRTSRRSATAAALVLYLLPQGAIGFTR